MRPMALIGFILFMSAFGLFSCLKDSCENNFCDNNGVCVDGTCDCPEAYTGVHCQEQVTPVKMRVNAVTMTRFPSTNEGMAWDPGDGPDIFFKMSEEILPLAQPEYLIENADPLTSYTFIVHPFDLRFVTSPYKMEMFDYDGPISDPQKMGELYFTPYTSMNGFPEVLVLDSGGNIAFRVEVQYYYPKAID